jgi:zinc transport system substrate-binding protein
VPHGASPESYSLLASQLKEISRSVVWFRMGYIGFELSWREKIEQINRDMKVVNLSEGLDLIVGEEVQHGDHVHLEGVDPHIWMSPKLVKQMAAEMTEELSELNPEKSDDYRTNYQKFVKEIDQLDAQIRNALKDHQGKALLHFIPACRIMPAITTWFNTRLNRVARSQQHSIWQKWLNWQGRKTLMLYISKVNLIVIMPVCLPKK